ncbi:hypothetical protein Fot_32322 [Forsythia ovata]|uniref:Uncharacterized protein n=1 Tax=Forsythia ovata TaxID=205694 RepID=A0ABD1T7L3_9LAMI
MEVFYLLSFSSLRLGMIHHLLLPLLKLGMIHLIFLSESSTSSPVDVQHQDKGKEIVVGKRENVASKRGLEGEDAVAYSGRIKKSRMALHQEILDSVPASSIAVQDPFLIRPTGWSVSTLGLVKMN